MDHPHPADPQKPEIRRSALSAMTILTVALYWLMLSGVAHAQMCTLVSGSGTATTPNSDSVVACLVEGVTTPVTAANGSSNVTVTVGDGATAAGLIVNGAPAVTVENSSTVTINNGTTISTTGNDAHGVLSKGAGSTITVGSGAISTTGEDANGVAVEGSGTSVTINGMFFVSTGDSSDGVEIDGSNNSVIINSGTISTSGDGADGVDLEDDNHSVTINGGTITTTGASAGGVDIEDNAHTVTINGGTITTSGASADGVELEDDNHTLTVNGGTVSTSGENADGIEVVGSGHMVAVTGGTISTSGTSADGIDVENRGTTVMISGGSITATGNDADGLDIQGRGHTVSMTGGAIVASGQDGDALEVSGRNLTVTLSGGSIAATGTGGNAVLFNTPNGATNSLTIGTGVSVTGNLAANNQAGGVSQLTLNGTGSGSLAGDIANFQTIAKQDSGTFSLGGTISGTDTATVASGTLAINGSIGGDVDVQNGGTVGGTGTISGGENLTVAAGGTVAPGNSIGTLTVTGDFTPASGSFFLVEVDPTSSDKLAVTGTANLNGNGIVQVQPLEGHLVNFTTYTILTAGTLRGAFADVTSLDSTYIFALGTNGGAVTLTLLTGERIDTSKPFFTEDDTATKGTTILFDGGTLKLTATTTFGQPVTIFATGGVIDSYGSVVGLTGTITNQGSLRIIDSVGGGSVAFTDTLSGGTVTVGDGGTLVVNGTVVATLTVESLGTLKGLGLVAGVVTNQGTLAPGESPGVLTVDGAVVTEGDAARFVVDLDGATPGTGAGFHDQVKVTGNPGTFSAAGTLVPITRGITGSANNSFTPALGQSFTIVDAEGGVEGSFTGLTQPSSGLPDGARFDVLYDTTTVDLVVTPASFGNLEAAGIAQTNNQIEVGAAVEAIRPAAGARPSGDTKTVFDSLYRLDPSGFATAFDQIGGVVHAEAVQASLGVQRQFGAAVEARQRAARDGANGTAAQAQSVLGGFTLAKKAGDLSGGSDGVVREPINGLSAGAPFDDAWSVWARAVGMTTETNGDGNAAGYDTVTGFGLVGIDRPVGDQLRLGAAFGFARTDVDSRNNGGRSNLDRYQAMLYGSYEPAPWFVDAQFGYAFTRYETKRTIDFGNLDRTATSKADGHNLSASIRGGRQFVVDGFLLEPSVGLRFDRLHRNSFAEDGANVLNLTVDSTTMSALQTTIGATVRRRFRVGEGAVEPELRLAWQRDWLDRGATADAALSGAGFAVEGAKAGRDAAALGASVSTFVAGNLRAHVSYDAVIDANQRRHAVTAGLKLAW